MNPITLPTSPETRAALEKAGLILLKERPHFEEWRTKDEANALGLFQGTTPAIHGDWEVLAPALVVLGITIPGYRLVAEGDLEVIRDLLEEAGSKRQYDPSWIRPRLLSAMDALDRITQAKLIIEALSPHPSENGGSSPSPENGLSEADLETWADVTSQERGLHQVNPINQRAGAPDVPDVLTRIETVQTMPELDALRTEVVQAIHAGGTEEAFDRLQGAFIKAKNRLERIPMSERTW